MSVNFERCFENLTKLKMLKLSAIEQHNISDATFRPFRFSLTQLYINRCGLRILDVDTFKDLSKLTVLSLKDNSITYLPDMIFTSLSRLTTLDISKNQLKVISDTLLRPLRNLEYLFIGGRRKNPMNFILGEEFLNMTRLRQIAFSRGTIHALNSDTFRHLRHCPITDVSFSYCDISLHTISKDAFLPLRNVESMSFDMTPLTGSALHDGFYGLNGSPLRTLNLTQVNLSDYSAALCQGLDENNITVLCPGGCNIILRQALNEARHTKRMEAT